MLEYRPKKRFYRSNAIYEGRFPIWQQVNWGEGLLMLVKLLLIAAGLAALPVGFFLYMIGVI